MGGKKGGKKSKKGKTAAQKAAAKRHAKFKQTGVQTFGGKKTKFTKAEQKRIEAAGYSVAGYSKAAPRSDTAVQISKDIAKYGNTFPAGGLTISDAGRAQAEKNKAEAAAKAAAAKKEATRKSTFDPTRLNNNLVSFSASFNNPLTSNNYFNLGKNIRVPNEDTASFSRLFKDDLSQVTRTDKGFQTGDKSIKSFRPFKAFTKDMLATGPTPLARQAATRLLPGALKNISLGSQIFNQGREDSGLTQSLNQVGNINAGGLSIGFKSDPSTDIGARVGRFFTSLPGKVINAFSGDDTKVASAGGLNIGGVDSGDTEGSKTGRTVVTTDRDKNISYDVGGIAKDIGLGLADAFTGNRFDFDGLGRPGDDKTPSQKFETFKKSPLQQAILSKQLGVDANRIINEGGPAAESLMKNYISQIDSSSAKGIRNPIARLFKDTAGENQTDATAMAGRAMSAFSVDDENFSNDPNNLTKLLKFAGVPQLSEENVQDIRHTFNKDVTEDTGIPGKGLTNIPYSQALGFANRITSGKIKDGVEESMNQLNMKSVPTLDDAVALGSQFATNMKTEGTVTQKRMQELDTLYKKYGPGGGQAPTIPSIIKGIGVPRRTSGSGNNLTISGSNNMTATIPDALTPEILPLPTTVAQGGTNATNLAQLQKQAYNNQLSVYGMNPNYFANIMQQRLNTRPKRFRQVFNRGYF